MFSGSRTLCAGLTLEQVLARSIRQRKPFGGHAAHHGRRSTSMPSADPNVVPGASGATPPAGSEWGTQHATEVAAAKAMNELNISPLTPRGQSREEKELRLKIELEAKERASNAPRIRSPKAGSTSMNSNDLLSLLVAANRMDDWQAATSAFTSVMNDVDHHITINDAHMLNLVGVCAKSGHTEVLRKVIELAGARVGKDEVVTCEQKSTAELPLSKTILVKMIAALGRAELWTDALGALAAIQGQVPRDAFNAAIGACEMSLEWQRAVDVYSTMVARADEANSGVPAPNAVTHAALISCLELCGKNQMAKEFMLKLPPSDQSALTSSYAALIQVWSKRHVKSALRRF